MSGPNRLERAGLAVAAIAVAAMAVTILRMPMTSVDGRTLWGLQARLIHDAGRYPAPEYFDADYRLPHPQYPPLVPLAGAALLSAWPAEPALRVFPWLSYLACGALLWRELARRDPERGRMLALLFVLLPTLLLSEEGGADSGVADVVVGAALLGALLLFDAGRPWLAALAAAAAALTKNEGLVLGALAVGTSPWLGTRPQGGRAWAGALALFGLVVAAWLWLRAGIPAGMDEQYASRLALDEIARQWSRAGRVGWEMAHIAFAHPQRAGLFWWAVGALALLAPRPRAVWIDGRLVLVPVYVALLFVVYLVSPWPDVLQVRLSFERLLLHVAPLALLAVATQSTGSQPEKAPKAAASR